jgi:hypothetical protein
MLFPYRVRFGSETAYHSFRPVWAVHFFQIQSPDPASLGGAFFPDPEPRPGRNTTAARPPPRWRRPRNPRRPLPAGSPRACAAAGESARQVQVLAAAGRRPLPRPWRAPLTSPSTTTSTGSTKAAVAGRRGYSSRAVARHDRTSLGPQRASRTPLPLLLPLPGLLRNNSD